MTSGALRYFSQNVIDVRDLRLWSRLPFSSITWDAVGDMPQAIECQAPGQAGSGLRRPTGTGTTRPRHLAWVVGLAICLASAWQTPREPTSSFRPGYAE